MHRNLNSRPTDVRSNPNQSYDPDPGTRICVHVILIKSNAYPKRKLVNIATRRNSPRHADRAVMTMIMIVSHSIN